MAISSLLVGKTCGFIFLISTLEKRLVRYMYKCVSLGTYDDRNKGENTFILELTQLMYLLLQSANNHVVMPDDHLSVLLQLYLSF